MSQTFELDPVKTGPLEPFEWDATNRFWIARTDVPIAVVLIAATDGKVSSIVFEYSGRETGITMVELDGRNDPPIHIREGLSSGKILELEFSHPVSRSELPRIAERIEIQSKRWKRLSTKFSYRMVANLLGRWSELVENQK